jgi:hypothetical protein
MIQKIIRLNPRLFEDLTERTFWHIPIVIGNGGIFTAVIVEPDFVAAAGLTIECESIESQYFGNFSIPKSR